MDPTKGAVEISLLLKAHLKQFNRTMITMTENMKMKWTVIGLLRAMPEKF